MPIIFDRQHLSSTEKSGASATMLANRDMLGTDALQVERILLQPGARSDLYPPREGERFVYVIQGKGQAQVHDQTFPLEAESVLWLEHGDTLSLEAELDGLEVLLCHAPASS